MYLSFLLPSVMLATSVIGSETSSKESRSLSRSRARKPSSAIYPRASCEPAEPTDTVTDRLNNLLRSGGQGYTLSLCPNQNYPITAPLQFTAPRQEINTQGLPTDGSRAMLTVSGPVLNGNQPNHTSAVIGQCPTCNDVKLRHIQINGNRGEANPVGGGANIEMGGHTSGQVVEYVRSFDPRSWSCLHIAEGGGLSCSNALVQNNDIGPCGSDQFRQWADGISIACANTVVKNNLVNSATDGGIVLFGSPGSLVENNTIWVEKNTLLGGINLVDYDPWTGDYDGTVVRENNIVGGLATDSPTSAEDSKGSNNENAIIKLGIAIGPRVWFGNHYLANVSHGGIVENNRFEGFFGYAMAMSSARNFTVQNNQLVGNTTFLGASGPNCTKTDKTVPTNPFVIQQDNVTDSSIQPEFVNIKTADGLTCITPPDGGDYWPFGGNHDPNAPPVVPGAPSPAPADQSEGGNGTSKGTKIGLGVGIGVGVLLLAALALLIRRRVLARRTRARQPVWVQNKWDRY